MPSVLLGISSLALALLLAVAIRPAANASSLWQFAGRFHPLVVHLPIGVLLAVALAETLTWSGRLRERIDPILGLVFPFLAVSALSAFLLGLLIARGGGYPPRLIALHRGFMLAAIAGFAVCAVVWSVVQRRGHRWRLAYRASLGITVTLLSVGAHFGGSLSRGDDYLVHHAPAFVQRWLGGRAHAGAPNAAVPGPTDEPLVFADVVLPVLRSRCVECHGPAQSKKRLRLDSLAGILQGGEGGPAVLPGKGGASLLVERMTLPKNHDDHMPPGDRPAPSAEEIQLIRWWIDRGASDSLRVRDAVLPDGARQILAHAAAAEAHDVGALTPPPASAVPVPVAAAAVSAEPATGSQRLVARDIVVPMLAARCSGCHGPTKQKGNLRVDSLQGIFAGGKSGPGVVPGDPSRSRILARLRLPMDHDEHMPPLSEPQLSASQIELLAWWIDKGASATMRQDALPAHLSRVSASLRAPKVSQEPAARPGAPEPVSPAAAQTPSDRDDRSVKLYQQVVSPILVRRCGACHTGPHVSGGLRVDDRASMISEHDVIPGKPDKSPLLIRMKLPASHAAHMPPSDKPQPSAAEIELIRTWIASGAAEDAVIDRQELPPGLLAQLSSQQDSSGVSSPHPATPVPGAARAVGQGPRHVAGCAACAIAHPDHRSDTRALWLWGLASGLLIARSRRRALRAPCAQDPKR